MKTPTHVCFSCGNGPTMGHQLKWSGDGRLAHTDECPEQPNGWHECAECSRMCMPDDLYVAAFFPNRGGRFGSPPAAPRRYEVILDEFPELDDELQIVGLPEGTTSVVILRGEDGLRYSVCNVCARHWPAGSRKLAWKAKGTSGGGVPSADERRGTRRELIPSDRWSTVEAIATAWGVSTKTVRRDIEPLVEDGSVTVAKRKTRAGGKDANVYRRVETVLTEPDDEADSDDPEQLVR